jgi:hypothetical protein
MFEYTPFPGNRLPCQGTKIRINQRFLNFKNAELLRKDLSANPCHEIGPGELCPPLSGNLK